MKVVVTSCCKIQQINPQKVWAEIQDEHPDALILLGDNIYLEHNNHQDPEQLRTELRSLYDAQLREDNFSALLDSMRQRSAPVLSIYDDHDFLGNNRYGGDNAPLLGKVAREELIRAFSTPRTGDDVYSCNRYGLVDIVILDERFYRQDPRDSRIDRDAILGSKQWSWLEETISASHSTYLLIASSSTFHRFGFSDEQWEEYPAAFERLRSLLRHNPGKFVVSGDIHKNDMYDDSGVLEIVTSGVARKGIVFGAFRKNYGVFSFDEEALHVDLRSEKRSQRYNFSIQLSDWRL